jgi:hypothetical protein
MTLEEHLAWLLYLMSEHPEGWKQHCWHRAKELAAERPELADLPAMLASSAQQQSSSSSAKPAEQPGMVAPGESPAPTSSTHPRARTGRRPTSSLGGLCDERH